MNKYFVKIGYSCRSYGELTGFVYAESQEQAEELIYNQDNIYESDYETNDSEDYNYYEDEAIIELSESNITPPARFQNSHNDAISSFGSLPNYFLAELNAL